MAEDMVQGKEGRPADSREQAAAPQAQAGRDSGRRAERLPGAYLNLKLGAPLVLQIAQTGGKYAGTVVGFGPYSFIIVQARMPQDVLERLGQNARLTAQHTSSGRVYAFRTHLLSRVSNPATLLVLSFPDTVDRVCLRSNRRVSVNLLGMLRGKYGEYPAVVVDLATSGCKLSVKVDLRSALRGAQPGDELVLTCQVGPGEPLIIPVDLRRVVEEKGHMSLGARFVDMSPEGIEAVSAYLDALLKYMDA